MEFVIDIESDSTIAKDENAERSSRQDMLTSVGTYASTVLPMVQQGYMPAGVSSAILQAALQPYTKYSRSLDEELNNLQTTEQQLQQMQQQTQQLQQEKMGLEQQVQQWSQVATVLQQQSTEAKSAKDAADAELKKIQKLKVAAETDKIVSETEGEPTDVLDRMQAAADIDETVASTDLKNRTQPNRTVQ
jgi:chromosome segregation ATPase